MKFNDILNSVKSAAACTGLTLKKHAPKIMAVIGTAGLAFGIYDACKQTLGLPEVLDEMKDSLDVVHNVEGVPELAEKYPEEDCKKTVTAVYIRAAINICKLYARPAAIILISLGLLLGSNKILENRLGDAAALAAITKTEFDKYRKNVTDRFGEEVDKQLRYGIQTTDISELGEDGEETKKTVADKTPELPSQFTRFFDEISGYWKKDADANKQFLLMTQAHANDILHSYRGKVVTLNDVLDMLDLPRMKIGQSVGWVNHGLKSDYIDFGIFDVHSPAKREFVNGTERSILLEFNVQGNILDDIENKK